jgi:hypothetical protein
MNILEKEMFNLLKQGRDAYGFTHIRAEFEAEGTRFEDLLRLIEIGYKAGLNLVIKISGCESMAELTNARQLGASAIIVSMIESTYALKKYAQSCEKVFPKSQGHEAKFYFNIETTQAYTIQQELIKESRKLGLDGVVFGRVDFAASMNFSRTEIESPMMTQKVIDVAITCQQFDQELILGGAISADSIVALKEIANVYLSHFETRKIVFDKSQLNHPTLTNALQLAAKFEWLWLKNKQNYYQEISNEDELRIKLLKQRL